MKTICYVDGLNLYYGLFKNRKNKYSEEYKWLNLEKLVRAILPSWGECKIMYFTSRVGKNQSGKSDRQEVYLRALRTIDGLEITKGRILHNVECEATFQRVIRRKDNNIPIGLSQGDRLLVRRSEEKKTDVNLATRMSCDLCETDVERVVLLSNDTDFVAPLNLARKKLGRKNVGIIFPTESRDVNLELRKIAGKNTTEIISEKHLTESKFNDVLETKDGRKLTNPWQQRKA